MSVDPNKIKALVNRIPKQAKNMSRSGGLGGLVALAALGLSGWALSTSLYNGMWVILVRVMGLARFSRR
jgi:hypothetical protein